MFMQGYRRRWRTTRRVCGRDAGPCERNGVDGGVQDQPSAACPGGSAQVPGDGPQARENTDRRGVGSLRVRDGKEKLVAKATVTLAPVEAEK